tara:strand:+ start:2184 stop:2597 length:414 start_codon:yes stop_codon:yes gene_type:complete
LSFDWFSDEATTGFTWIRDLFTASIARQLSLSRLIGFVGYSETRSTLRDVAREAGVSVKMVSNVIHDHPNVTPKTKEKVDGVIKAVSCAPNLSARSLRTGKTNVIGLSTTQTSGSHCLSAVDSRDLEQLLLATCHDF